MAMRGIPYVVNATGITSGAPQRLEMVNPRTGAPSFARSVNIQAGAVGILVSFDDADKFYPIPANGSLAMTEAMFRSLTVKSSGASTTADFLFTVAG